MVMLYSIPMFVVFGFIFLHIQGHMITVSKQRDINQKRHHTNGNVFSAYEIMAWRLYLFISSVELRI